jgi:hypothetical protein
MRQELAAIGQGRKPLRWMQPLYEVSRWLLTLMFPPGGPGNRACASRKHSCRAAIASSLIWFWFWLWFRRCWASAAVATITIGSASMAAQIVGKRIMGNLLGDIQIEQDAEDGDDPGKPCLFGPSP